MKKYIIAKPISFSTNPNGTRKARSGLEVMKAIRYAGDGITGSGDFPLTKRVADATRKSCPKMLYIEA